MHPDVRSNANPETTKVWDNCSLGPASFSQKHYNPDKLPAQASNSDKKVLPAFVLRKLIASAGPTSSAML
jgi:hypothetical protein